MRVLPQHQMDPGEAANDPAPQDTGGWNAYEIWRERVKQTQRSDVKPEMQTWDPHFVWLSRVRKDSES